MRHTLSIHLDPGEEFRICGLPHAAGPILEIQGTRAESVPFRIHFRSAVQLAEFHDVIALWLYGPESDGSADRADIVPAEAVVDVDDLLADMAASYDVRRSRWEGEATAAEMATGRANCPRQVP